MEVDGKEKRKSDDFPYCRVYFFNRPTRRRRRKRERTAIRREELVEDE